MKMISLNILASSLGETAFKVMTLFDLMRTKMFCKKTGM